MTPVAVIGAAGFAGSLLCALVDRHPDLTLGLATARGDAGRRLDTLYPQLGVDVELEPFVVDEVAERARLAFVCLPHGASATTVLALLDRGLRVVDLSADFRLADASLYPRWYGAEHPAPDLLASAVYGLPELGLAPPEAWPAATLVANPGCNATAVALALHPVRDLLAATPGGLVVCDVKAGISGAGREPTARTHFSAVADNVTPYAVTTHRHTPEVEQALGLAGRVQFQPHVVAADRGVLATCYVAGLAEAAGLDELGDRVAAAYPPGSSVVTWSDTAPDLRATQHTDRAVVHLTADRRTGALLAFCSLDNLGKGAAGAAVQNANLMLGLPATAGLRL